MVFIMVGDKNVPLDLLLTHVCTELWYSAAQDFLLFTLAHVEFSRDLSSELKVALSAALRIWNV